MKAFCWKIDWNISSGTPSIFFLYNLWKDTPIITLIIAIRVCFDSVELSAALKMKKVAGNVWKIDALVIFLKRDIFETPFAHYILPRWVK